MQTYKLAGQIGGKGQFALVSGHLEIRENSDGNGILGQNAFNWIKRAYGPDALLPQRDHEFVKAAFRGVEIALQELAAENLKVVIDELQFLVVDTSQTNMALAAYQLTFQLVNGKPRFEKVNVEALEYINERI
jgi:hypothetical protein